MNKRFNYVAQSYRQGSSDLELFTFCASANEIKQWGGVPAKSERFHGGFQRALGDRYRNIMRYFDDGQASPTSIVVAFREGTLSASPLGYPGNWTSVNELSQVPEFKLLTFEAGYTELDSCDLAEMRAEVAKRLKTRLERSSGDSGESPDESMDTSEGLETVDESEDEQSLPDALDDELDVGHSKLQAFYEFISDDVKVEDWLAKETSRYDELRKKAKRTKKDEMAIAETPAERLKYLLASLLRPAMIVDGQHRVWGAYESEKSPIVFNVCAIKDASWIEQVFQFVVLNKLAKPISAGFLTSILNTSLTNAEVKDIERRFDTIRIKNTDRKIMKYLSLDERSPFFGRVASPGEVAGVDNKGKLSDKGMINLAKTWLNLRHDKKKIEMFQKALKARTITDARAKWHQDEVWTQYFYAFWNAIKEKYERDQIWDKRENVHLLYIVTMHAMQDMFLEAKSEADVKFKSAQHMAAEVSEYFKDVPGPFFMGWEATGLQSGDGPQWIMNAIKSLRAGQQLGTVTKNSELFAKPKK